MPSIAQDLWRYIPAYILDLFDDLDELLEDIDDIEDSEENENENLF